MRKCVFSSSTISNPRGESLLFDQDEESRAGTKAGSLKSHSSSIDLAMRCLLFGRKGKIGMAKVAKVGMGIRSVRFKPNQTENGAAASWDGAEETRATHNWAVWRRSCRVRTGLLDGGMWWRAAGKSMDATGRWWRVAMGSGRDGGDGRRVAGRAVTVRARRVAVAGV
ncbi:unnamed protein product [Linum trigynum]|uniref:Uncharacterized protein n=1 Tax=Linum trigynum TaxID=586398 RepID=A0AAV2CTH7_9ROSI